MKSRQRLVSVVTTAAGVVLLAPSIVLGCERCLGASKEGVQQAYLTGFFILSGLALFVVASASIWLYRWNRQVQATQAANPDP